ncbi:substrate-binding periplasmic protein [Colwellia piezophila]|uniref:substrate-binding periplasmic protein n=1 Tax=Colwellia piezophila TaxID=211668 RepID=UPI000399E209|nr:transporter substrate-binding domain-containing protein [Colwellia piezophila]
MTYLIFTSVVQADNNVEKLSVSYYLEGQKHIVYGEKTPQGYRFNADSEKVLHLASSNWPPYISEDLCNRGWIFQFAVAILASKGYQVNIHFFPWARSVKIVEQGEMDILFPAYYIDKKAPSDYDLGKTRRELLALSNAFSGGSVALVQRKGGQLTLDAGLSVLNGKMIGVIRGYQNTQEFDAMMAAKMFSIAQAADELQLVKLLVANRVDLIIGDPKVFTFSVNVANLSTLEKQHLLEGMELVQPALQYHPLYFVISKKSAGHQQILRDINIAISLFEKSGEIDRLISAGYQCSKNNEEHNEKSH